MFIRGIIGLCPCGAELSVRRHVFKPESFGAGFSYHTLCDCGAESDLVIHAAQHKAAARYLRQVVENPEARDTILEPVSAEEEELALFAKQLGELTVTAEMFSARSD